MEKAKENESARAIAVTSKRQKRRRIIRTTVASVIVLFANLIFFFMLWMIKQYKNVQFDQILYQAKSPIEGTNSGIVANALLVTVLPGVLTAALEIIIYIFLTGTLKDKLSSFKAYITYSATRVASFFKKRYMTISSLILIASIFTFIFRLEIHVFVSNQIKESSFIEEHYVDPDKASISFPEAKRNLIYIYLESMENTFSDVEVIGEKVPENPMPELSAIRENNISFSSNGGKYGAYSYVGTTWTAAGMFAQTSGVPIKVALDFNTYGMDGDFMPGITTLGDILSREGYNQSLLLGSDASFAARDTYITEHGNYNIIDVYTLIDEGKLPDDYWEWWGVEDAKLFDFAKEEITRLSSEGKPFNFTTLTADTHCPDGYFCDECESKYEDQYANVLACSSKQIAEFLGWLKAQPFYENTTVIISGDHLTMDTEFLENLDDDYIRTVYNCIINAPIEPVRKSDREFGTFDMFPTTLAALGATIEGDRLGLGTNLFSAEKTLTEIYGFDMINSELSRRSEFYLKTFYEKE